MKRYDSLLVLFIVFITIFGLSACKADEKINKESISLRVFSGEVQIPEEFISRPARNNNSVTFSRKLKGTKDVEGSYSIITKGSKKEDYYQEYIPKNDNYRMTERIKLDKLTVEIWTPKEGMPLANVYYDVLIYNDKEFLGVASEDLSLWRTVLDSYKSDDKLN